MDAIKSHDSKPNRLRLLVAEDNPSDAALISKLLERSDLADFEIIKVASLADALREMARSSFDAVILDLFLPDSQGLTTLESFLNLHRSCPVIVLTGYEHEAIGVEAIRKGAEEYLFKGEIPETSLPRFISMSVERWISRMKSASDNTTKINQDSERFPLSYGPLKIDILNQTIALKSADSETSIALTPIEFRLLVLLTRHCGEILSRSRIVSEIWRIEEKSISIRTVDKHVSALKSKLHPALAPLESIYGVGYRLNYFV